MEDNNGVTVSKTSNNEIVVGKDSSGRVTVAFSYDAICVQKVKSIPGHRWHPDKKHWSFPDTDGTLTPHSPLKLRGDKGGLAFKGEEIHIDPALYISVRVDPALQVHPSTPVIARSETTKQSQDNPSLAKRGEGRFSDKKLSSTNFDDLKRELLSRKYSYKTVKGYLYYNRDFLSFIKKEPADVQESDIKDYLLYLAEEKQSATSTLNQAINALKFYYGSMLKRKFIYEVKRPRKDKKLPIVLSKEEVAKIINSVDNLKHKAILMLVYSAGLRVGEVVKLRPEDIDSKRMFIHIRGSKGRKDRYTMLSETALDILRKYWREYKPEKWLFEGARAGGFLAFQLESE